MSSPFRRLAAVCLVLLCTGALSAQTLVKDIHPGTYALGSNPTQLLNVNGTLYFSAQAKYSGMELWKSDGTTAGTVMVKDIACGFTGSEPLELTNLNGQLIFSASDWVHGGGPRLWISDGTFAGTRMVSNSATFPAGIVVRAGVAYFRARANYTDGVELWRSDGTTAGTWMVKNINPSGDSHPTHLTVLGGYVYFAANDGTNGVELWRSDGTEAGTQIVKNIAASSASSTPSTLRAVNGKLFFVANDGSGAEPFVSDGTSGGTNALGNFNAGGASIPLPDGAAAGVDAAVAGGYVYFALNDGTTGTELWRSDGTPEGTARVKDLEVGSGSSDPSEFVAMGNKVGFAATTAALGREAWISDGTSPGTINLTNVAGGSLSPKDFFATATKLYFLSGSNLLYASDGTPGGTAFVRDVWAPYFGSWPPPGTSWAEMGGHVYLGGGFNNNGLELVRTDGTSVGTTMVANLYSDAETGAVSFATTAAVNGKVLFRGKTAQHGVELWSSDGTSDGTVMVKDIQPTGSSFPEDFVVSGGKLFFTATDSAGEELWVSDGTTANTNRVMDIHPGASHGDPRYPTDVNGLLYFSANDGTSGHELWVSDGTPAGTRRVKDISPGSSGSHPQGFRNFNGKVFFFTITTNTWDAWISDGTDAGTIKLAGPFSSSYGHSQILGNDLIFYANNNLWKTNGTPEGTQIIRSMFTTSRMFALNGKVVFWGSDFGSGMWSTDGTTGGTTKYVDPAAGAGYSRVDYIHQLGNTIFFSMSIDGIEGDSLWKTDGTAAGTVMVKRVNPDPGLRADIDGFYTAGGHVYFRASDGVHGEELWRTDGTNAGTVMVADLDPGPNGSWPMDLTELNGKLFFTGHRYDVGDELWWLCLGTTQYGLAVSTNTPEAGSTLYVAANALTASFAQNACYTGTVRFTSSDPNATLPADYTYTSADGGGHLFTMTMRSAGTRSITVTDVAVPSLTGTVFVNVAAGPAATTTIGASPSLVLADGVQQSTVTVQVRDAFNNGVAGATVALQSTFGSLSGVTNAGNGNYTATLTATTDGTATITGTVNGSAITGNAVVHFTTDFNRKGDFDADGNADLLWRNGGLGQTELWRMDGATRLGVTALPVIGGEWTIGGIADFDANGRADLLWRRADGTVAIWLMNGGTIVSSATVATVPAEWVLQGAGDFTGDGKADLLWRNSNTSAAVVWTMNGTTIVGAIGVASPNSDWALKGIGDFNGDRIADLLWYNHTNNHAVVWLMNGGTINMAAYVAAPPSMWQVQGVGDFNVDGRVDLLWRNADTNQVVVWLMNGAAISGTAYLASPPPAWTLGAISDFDGDRDADLVWRNGSTGENAMWVMNGAAIEQGVFLQAIADQGWQIAGPR